MQIFEAKCAIGAQDTIEVVVEGEYNGYVYVAIQYYPSGECFSVFLKPVEARKMAEAILAATAG